MCGIAGLITGDGLTTAEDIAAVKRMMCVQDHRGPDGEGFYRDGRVLLGHCRLAILDLSEAGRQPLSNQAGTVWVAYNGEIYNFRALRAALVGKGYSFTSQSDTEVLVHGYEEWGIEGLLQRLRGMFAIALYDCRRSAVNAQLILARDRFGIKPLYYTALQGCHGLAFASEVQALRRSCLTSREDDPRAWLAYFLFGSIPAPWTTMRAVQALPPGHYLVTDGSALRCVRYYTLEALFAEDVSRAQPEFSARIRVVDLREKIRALLEETVALHLISDAPLGLFLSGGIDSSALVALAACQQQELVTVGVVFEEQAFSEEGYQRAVAERFKTRHHSVLVTRRDFQAELERFLEAMDQPTIDGLNTYFVARAAHQVGLKAVLSGIGGDEVFCGYPTLRRASRLGHLRRFPSPLRATVIAVGNLRPSLRKLAFLQRNGHLPFYLVQRGLFTPRETAQLLGTQEVEAWRLIESLEPATAPHDPVLLQQFLEARHYLVDQLLKDADVFGMAHSVEVRVPFLDHLLTETILKIPQTLRLDSQWPKPLLTKPLQDLLPEQVVFRPKQGFTFPVEVWLRASGNMFQETGPMADDHAYQAVWQAFLSGRAHWSRPWALAVMERFQVRMRRDVVT
jgi:asparagine synthase (glutamine-hydrolysing)